MNSNDMFEIARGIAALLADPVSAQATLNQLVAERKAAEAARDAAQATAERAGSLAAQAAALLKREADVKNREAAVAGCERAADQAAAEIAARQAKLSDGPRELSA
jgi:hypothetical protein